MAVGLLRCEVEYALSSRGLEFRGKESAGDRNLGIWLI